MGSKTIESEHNKVQNHLQLCRLCLSEELLEDIFKHDDLNMWISDFLSITVSEDDKISRCICVLCRARLTEFRDFQLRCLEVQDVLQGESSRSFEKDLPLSETKKMKPSSEIHPELTINEIHLQDSLEARTVKIESDADSMEMTHELQDDLYASVEGCPDFFEAEEQQIKPESNPEETQDDSTSTTEECLSLLQSGEAQMSEPYIGSLGKFMTRPFTLKKLQPSLDDVLKSQECAETTDKVQSQRTEITETGQKILFYLKQKINSDSIHPSGVAGHQNKHNGIRPFKCERGCENVDFFSQKIRDAHYSNIHNAQKQECPICHKWYRSKASLSCHKSIVHSGKIFKCSLCNKPFTTITRLKKHMKIHSQKNINC